MARTPFSIQRLATEAEARETADFLLSEHSFDDFNPTPGERLHYENNPYLALQGGYTFHLARSESGEMIGVNSFMENEQLTGGYYWDYLVVHKNYRSHGVAGRLIRAMMEALDAAQARYLVTYTSDSDCYASIREMFGRLGFVRIGQIPDYYFEGEDRLIYYRKLPAAGRP